jgi:hypothetical protein
MTCIVVTMIELIGATVSGLPFRKNQLMIQYLMTIDFYYYEYQ